MKIQLLKPLFLLLGLLFLMSCQEDFINEENISTESDQSRKLFFDYKTIDNAIKEESALKKSVQKIQNKSLTSSVYNFSFDENKVQIMQDSTYTQYTFLIKRDNPTDYTVENYICRVFENDSVQQFITSYPVIGTQDSLEIDYTSGTIQKIQDDAIDVIKMVESCVPVFTQIEEEVIVSCTGDDHSDPDECDCDGLDSCEPPSTVTITKTIFTLQCGNVGGSDNSDGYDGPDNNNPDDGPSYGGSNNYGGGNNNSDSSDYPDFLDPVEPELLPKLPVREYFENLDDDKKDCYENSGLNNMGTGNGKGLNPTSMIEDIEAFLNENTTNGVIDPEAQAFADAILEDCDSGQEVDFEESLIYVLPECLDDIVFDLKTSQNGKFSTIMDQFVGHSPAPENYNWAIISQDANGSTDATASTSPFIDAGNFVETIIYEDNVQNATDLSMSRTLIHEAFHAYLVFEYRFSNIDKSYRNLLDQYAQQHNNNANDTHHAFFIHQNVISKIAEALQEFGEKQNYLLSEQYYEDMAWGGLTHYRDSDGNLVINPAFQQAFPSQSDQQRILNILEAEKTGQIINGTIPQGNQACP